MNANELADVARSLFAEALAECSVERALESKLTAGGAHMPNAFSLRGGGEPEIAVDLADMARLIVVAVGKASAPMLQALLRKLRLPGDCEVAGVIIAPQRPEGLSAGIQYFAGGHPLPSAESLAGAKAALALIEQSAANAERTRTFCLFLISGGASAMVELPLDSSISLEDAIAFHRALVHSGATIAEINCVRKHFSAVKGGRLGRAAAAMSSLTLLVSDVPRGHLDALGSGPSLPDSSTVAECRDVLARYGLMREFPAAVRAFFLSKELPETPKPGEFVASAFTLLSAGDLAEAARRKAESLGFAAIIDTSSDEWEVHAAAEFLLARLRDLRRQHGRVCLISGGEVTVEVPRQAMAGSGGRNQHFALYAATLLTAENRNTVVFSAGSDGIDGNSRFAGAVLDFDGLRAAGVENARKALRRFDSSTFLNRMGAAIETGPTGNNLRDLRLLLSA